MVFSARIMTVSVRRFFLQFVTPEEKPKALNHHKINGCGYG